MQILADVWRVVLFSVASQSHFAGEGVRGRLLKVGGAFDSRRSEPKGSHRLLVARP